MDDLVREWEEASRLADETLAKVKAFTDAGLAAPQELVVELALREEAVLAKQQAVQEAKPPGAPLH